MIIQIRGTSGSGKTWVMREVMKRLPGMLERKPIYVEGRKQPLYYLFEGVAVLGHYEATCGGCDNVGSARAVYDLIHKVYPACGTVLCEGLLLSEDTKWTKELAKEYPGALRVIFLTTPLEKCLSQIESRRKEAGNDKPLNPFNTSNRVTTIERARGKLEAEGILCRRCSPNQAPSIVINWLRAEGRMI